MSASRAMTLATLGVSALLACELKAPQLPARAERSARVGATSDHSSSERATPAPPSPPSPPPAQLSPWSLYSPEVTTLTELRGAYKLSALPSLASAHHLCLGVSPDGPPTIAWRGSESPPLTLPTLPRGAEGLLLLIIDWDTPKREAWRRLNETYRGALEPNAQVARAPHVLWAMVTSKEAVHAWPTLSAAAGRLLPAGLGGRGDPFQARPLSRGAYHALNDYSDWFSHAPLKAPSRGYAGPCVPRLDPRPHQVTALAIALKRLPDLPSEGATPLSAQELITRALPQGLALSRFDWRATLVHDPVMEERPPAPPFAP